MNKLKFYVAALPYAEHDGGKMVLHNLAYEIAKLGEDVTVVCPGINNPVYNNVKHINGVWTEISIESKYSVGIYPEIASTGNALKTELCVRWLLGTPDHPHGDYNKKDLVYTATKELSIPDMSLIKGNLRMINLEENLKFTDENRHIPGTTCHMFRKAGWRNDINLQQHPGDSFCIDDFDEKGGNVYLKEMFNNYETFICYDDRTFIPVQAALCGCNSIVVPIEGGRTIEQWREFINVGHAYGIAYGFDQVDWAKETRHLLRDELIKLGNSNIEDIRKMIKDCYNWFNIEYYDNI